MLTTLSTNQPLILRTDACRVLNEADLEGSLGRLLLPRMSPMQGKESKVYPMYESLLSLADGSPRPAFGIDEFLADRANTLGLEFDHDTNSLMRRIAASPQGSTLPMPAATGFIQSVRAGVIMHDDQLQALALSVAIALGFTKSVVYFLSSKRSQLRALAKRLSDHSVVHLLMDNNCKEVPDEYFDDHNGLSPQVVLSTFKGIDSSHFTHADLAIFLSAPEVLHEQAAYMLTAQPDLRPNFFALMKASTRLSPRESTAIAAMFGPRMTRIGADGSVRRPAHRVMVDFRGAKRSALDTPSPTPYLAFVATLSRGVLGGAVREQRFRKVLQWLRDHNIDRPRITIVASSSRTAIELAKRLPSFALATKIKSSGPAYDRLSQPDRETLAAGRRRLQRSNVPGLISTVAELDAVASTGSPDVVFWVSESAAVAELPAAWTHQEPGRPRPLLWVDVKDRSVATGKDLRQRDREYDQRDIFEVGVNEVEGRVRRFWADQERWQREAA